MSTEYSTKVLDLNHPRSIWSNSIQLLYTLLAMIPLFYYLREIVNIDNKGLYVLLFIPVTVGLLLFFIELLLNEYYFYEEKEYKKRDIAVITAKSTAYILFLFYFVYLFMFGYWFSSTIVYTDLIKLENNIGKVITESGMSILVILFIVLLRRGIQNQK